MRTQEIAFVLLLLIALASCIREGSTADAGLDGGPPDGGPLVESPSRYQECVLGTSCPGAEEVCFAIRGNGTETAWCTIRCATEADCAGGALCLGASGTVDDGPRCHEACTVDADCNAPGFGCYRVGIMSTRGMFDAYLCYPNAR